MSEKKERQKTEVKAEGMTFEKPNKTRKPRDRSWDREHNYQIASYRIDIEVKQFIIDLAKKLKLSTADIAEYFLRHGIEAYKSGTLKIDREPKEYKIKTS